MLLFIYGWWWWTRNSVNMLIATIWVVMWYVNNLSINLFYKTELTEWIHVPLPQWCCFICSSTEARMLKWMLHIACICMILFSFFFHVLHMYIFLVKILKSTLCVLKLCNPLIFCKTEHWILFLPSDQRQGRPPCPLWVSSSLLSKGINHGGLRIPHPQSERRRGGIAGTVHPSFRVTHISEE